MIKLRSTLILVLSSVLIGGVIYWRSKKQSLETTYTLPSPHMTENETLFLSNITPEQITGWTLTSPTETLAVDRNAHHTNSGTSQFQSQSTPANPYWHVYYKTTPHTASKKTRDRRDEMPSYNIDFRGASSEILANGRNFLSLSYVNEDAADTSPLKALSIKYRASILKAEDLAAIDSSIVNVYSLTYQSLASLPAAASAPTAANPLAPKDLKTVTFLEGTAAAPFRKLYFQGKAYWVREWYVLALARHPAELYVKQFLTLSPHTLERIEKRTLYTTSANNSSTALGFTIIRTAPYTWQLFPARAKQEAKLTSTPSQFTPHNPSVQNNTPSKPPPKPSSIAKLTTSQITGQQDAKNNSKNDSQNNSQSNHLNSNPTANADTNSKVTAFIQMLLFLKAERALVLLSEAERLHITENALARSTLTLTSLIPTSEDIVSPHKKSNAAVPNKYPTQKQTITLYHYEAETYIETVRTEPLYLLSSQKPHTLLYYGYEDFLR